MKTFWQFFVALVIFVVLVIGAAYFSPQDKSSDSTLAERVQASCKKGYDVADWEVEDEGLISVTCTLRSGYGSYTALVER